MLRLKCLRARFGISGSGCLANRSGLWGLRLEFHEDEKRPKRVQGSYTIHSTWV